MPAKLDGNVLDADEAKKLLDGIGIEEDELRGLAYFLEKMDQNYKSVSELRQSFKADLSAIKKEVLLQQLVEMSNGDHRVKIEFVPDPETLDVSQAFYFGQNYIGISRYGKSGIFTNGFAGCMAVLLTPTTGAAGGIFAHISESGNYPECSRTAYHTEIIQWMMDKANDFK